MQSSNMSPAILHLVKTTDGASWALNQVRELKTLGNDIHVVLPDDCGHFIEQWRQTGATIHIANLHFDAARLWMNKKKIDYLRRLVDTHRFDVIHSHFVGTTITMRLALNRYTIPKIFQVPGPLHLEHSVFRQWELLGSNKDDVWVGSSRYIVDLYKAIGIPNNRLFLSYYGNDYSSFSTSRNGFLRSRYSLDRDTVLVGNINYMYPPKFYLFQRIGTKAHELVIDAISDASRVNRNVKGVLVGGQWGKGTGYETSLRKRALERSHGSVIMHGRMKPEDVAKTWGDFDIAVHAPISENCGGVIEPLLSGVPTIASSVGGIPEVIIDGLTGRLVPPLESDRLTDAIVECANDLEGHRQMATNGRRLVTRMFDVKRTAKEIHDIYRCVLGREQRPSEFDVHAYLQEIGVWQQPDAGDVSAVVRT
jgi:glycosyltransferase involved in cell wall biosynthesis